MKCFELVNEVQRLRGILKVALIGLTLLFVLSGSLTLTLIAIIGWSLYLAVKLKRRREKRKARVTYLKETMASKTLEVKSAKADEVGINLSRMLSFNGSKLIEVIPTTRRFVLDEKTPLVLLVSRFKVVGVGGVKLFGISPELEEELALLLESMQDNGIEIVVYGKLGYLRRRTPVHLLVYTKKFTLKISRKIVEDLSEKVAYALAKLTSIIGEREKYGLLSASELCSLLEGGVDFV